MKKILLRLLVLVLVAAGGAGAYLYLHLGEYVRQAIQREGTRMMKTGVSVSLVELSPFSGRGTLHGLSVANPEGYKGKEFLRADKISLSLDVRSLRAPVVHVRSVVIHDLKMDLEGGGAAGTNFQKIAKNLDESEAALPAKERAKKTRFIIGLFKLETCFIHMDTPRLKTEGQDLPLNDIELRDVGSAEGGITGAEATRKITGVLVKKAAEKPEAALKRRAADAARGVLDNALKGWRAR